MKEKIENNIGATNLNNQINSQTDAKKFQSFCIGSRKNLTLNIGQISNVNEDYEFPELPNDTVSHLKFSPVNDFVAATSWDGNVLFF